jgi:hypothetical protein
MSAAMRRASSWVRRCAAERRSNSVRLPVDVAYGWSTDQGGGSGGGRSRGQITRLGRQPFANDASAELAIVRPSLREAIVDDVVALDAERVLDDPGGAISVVAVVACARRFHIGVDDIRQRLVIDRDQRERFVGYRLAGRPNRFCTTASALVPTFIEA